MKPKTLILMIVAIGCGLAASYMTSRVIADRSAQPTDEKVTILVARQNLPMGVLIKEPEKFFEEKQFTKGEEPKKAIRSFDDLKGVRLNKPISAEQFVTADDLLSKDKDLFASLLPKGFRAVAIKVTADTVAGGFVQPHSRVDIVSIIRRNEAETISKILLQNILVLAVDQTAVRSEDKAAAIPNTVTVQVTPEQAEKLSMAQELGTLRLSLRPFGDEENVTTRGYTPKQILQGTANRADEAVGLEETGSSGRPVGLTRIPDVPSGTKAPADGKPVEPTTPARTHTLTIYNGDAVTKAVFTLDKADEGKTTKEEKIIPEPAPASKKDSPKTSPPKAKP